MLTDTFGFCLLIFLLLSMGYTCFMIVSFSEEVYKAYNSADNGGEG